MAGYKRAGGDEPLCGSTKMAKRQITKATFKKKTIWSIRRYHGYDVTSMPKEPTWSLSIAQYVGSTYDR